MSQPHATVVRSSRLCPPFKISWVEEWLRGSRWTLPSWALHWFWEGFRLLKLERQNHLSLTWALGLGKESPVLVSNPISGPHACSPLRAPPWEASPPPLPPEEGWHGSTIYAGAYPANQCVPLRALTSYMPRIRSLFQCRLEFTMVRVPQLWTQQRLTDWLTPRTRQGVWKPCREKRRLRQVGASTFKYLRRWPGNRLDFSHIAPD